MDKRGGNVPKKTNHGFIANLITIEGAGDWYHNCIITAVVIHRCERINIKNTWSEFLHFVLQWIYWWNLVSSWLTLTWATNDQGWWPGLGTSHQKLPGTSKSCYFAELRATAVRRHSQPLAIIFIIHPCRGKQGESMSKGSGCRTFRLI